MGRLAIELRAIGFNGQIALAGVRRSIAFVAASSLAGIVGVFVIVAGSVAIEAAAERGASVAASYPVPGDAVTAGALVQSSVDLFRDREVATYRVAVMGAADIAAPPGIARLPEDGEIVASPAAARLLAADEAFAQRYPGEVIGLIDGEGLVGPRELVIWAGVPTDDVGGNAVPVERFGSDALDLLDVPDSVRAMVPILVAGFLLPVLVLLFEAASTGARSREPRLAALRLLGVPRRRLRAIAAVESVVATLPGVIIGLLIFGFVAGLAGPHLPVNGGVWPTQLRPSAQVLVGAGVAITGLAGLMAWWSLRRIQDDFLLVIKRAPARSPAPRRLAILVIGAVALTIAAGVRSLPGYGVSLSAGVLLVAVVLILVGLVRGLPVLVRAVAHGVEGAGGPWVVELSAAKSWFSPVAVSRVASGAVVLVFVSGLFMALVPSTASVNATAWRAVVDGGARDLIVASAQSLPDGRQQMAGIDSYASIRQMSVSLGAGAGAGDIYTIAVVDCAALVELLDDDGLCAVGGAIVRAGTVGDLASAMPVREYEAEDGTVAYEAMGSELRVETSARQDDAAFDRASPIFGSVIAVVDSSAVDLPDAVSEPYLVLADPADDIELARTAVLAITQASYVRTVGEMISESERTTRMLRSVAEWILVALALVAAATIVATVTGHVRAERLAVNDLWRVGVPLRKLRQSLVLQMVFGNLPGILAALPLGVAVAWVFVRLDGDRTYGVAWESMVLLACAAIAIPIAAAVAVAPAIRVVERVPSEDRTTATVLVN